MEDVLELYAEPYDPSRPVVCSDEAGKELRGHVAGPVPASPGLPVKEDYEYTRHGTADLFVVVEPLAGTRRVTVTERRTIPDFAEQMRALCDEIYPDAAWEQADALTSLVLPAYRALVALFTAAAEAGHAVLITLDRS